MAGLVSKDIYRLVETTTTEIDIMDRIYHGDVDAYNIDIEFYGVTSITGTCNLHFVLSDGTALDKDASDGVVIDGGNVKYTLPTYLYQKSGNLTMYVQFMNSNIYTPLKANFKNIVAIPDGGKEVVATTTYPVWYDEVVTNEDERVAAELIRISNEVSRVTAEDARTTWEEFNAITVYAVGEKVYYPTTGSSYVMHTASGIANTLPTDTDYWQIIAQKGASGTLDELSSTPITGVIAGDGTSIITASADDLPYVNTTSGLTATDAQAAIDELASEKEDSVNIGNRTYTEQNYVTNGETVTESLDNLDISLNAHETTPEIHHNIFFDDNPNPLNYNENDIILKEKSEFINCIVGFNDDLFEIPDSTLTVLEWDYIISGSSSIWNASNPGRLTVPSGVKKVRLNAQCNFYTGVVGSLTGRFEIIMNKNGSRFDGLPIFRVDGQMHFTRVPLGSSMIMDVTPGDYFDITVEQTRGITIKASKTSSWFGMEVI